MATNGTTNGTNGTNGTANGHHDLPALCTSAQDFLQHNYDFVVVGGGVAGLTVAARLTENPDVTVGVLEAGKNKLNDMLVDTPGMFLALLNNPEYDWQYNTVPQEANKGKVHNIPRGKALGGSSAINYMMYVRGSDQDYDDWAIIADDPSWGSAKMKQYMRKHQTLEPVTDEALKTYGTPLVGDNHGTSGPVRTSFNDYSLPIQDDVVKACDDVTGFSKKPADPWSGDHIGFFNTLGSVARTGPNKGKRSYAARGYFEANAHRPNLHVLCEALVSSVELEGDKATGVKFTHGGQQHQVKAGREVIVSGGTINSPQILELSGIGDPEVLKAAGIECKIENKGVGENLQDHSLTAAGYELAPGNFSLEAIYNPDVMADAQKQLMENQAGPLTAISSSQGFFPYKLFATEEEQKAVLQSIEQTPGKTPFQQKQYKQIAGNLKDDKSANLQFVMIGATADFEGGVGDQSRLFPPPATPDQPHGLTFGICLQYPLSRGSVHVKSSDPTEHPTYDPAFLKHPADAAVLAAGMKFLDKASQSPHLKDKISRRTHPPSSFDLSKTEDCKAWVHDWCLSEYHPCGSCGMGDVVDSQLKVKGTRGLRVIDASVFPNHVSGNIVSSVYAVAEKGADLIKADWDYAALAKAA